MYDLTYLSLGGGVQSSTIAEMMVDGELNPVDVVIFSDTGDEPDYVYEQVDYLNQRLSSVNIPLVVVSKGNMIEDLYAGDRRFAAIPVFTVDEDGQAGRMKRQCTHEYKIEPIEKYVRKYLLQAGKARQYRNGAIYINKGVGVRCLLGISLDEVQRMKPNKHKQFDNQWPLIDKRMTRHDCINWLKSHDLPIPYKSSCRICPFHNDPHWRWMKDERAGDWAHVVDMDNWLRNGNNQLTARSKGELFIHKSCVPMNEVDLSTQQDAGQLEMFDECDEGYCFI